MDDSKDQRRNPESAGFFRSATAFEGGLQACRRQLKRGGGYGGRGALCLTTTTVMGLDGGVVVMAGSDPPRQCNSIYNLWRCGGLGLRRGAGGAPRRWQPLGEQQGEGDEEDAGAADGAAEASDPPIAQ